MIFQVYFIHEEQLAWDNLKDVKNLTILSSAIRFIDVLKSFLILDAGGNPAQMASRVLRLFLFL